ncbi:hypothetical protein Smic_02700 [Streptomyces microflavus]|uniref:Uncharacterized protein n=1 Tax=Streptomyces microflavus TaxID=1919 RepID=A0A7J0CIF0_STRMI|nr:hypothetical protein Smic_02700 [Streptomyces microflavus]
MLCAGVTVWVICRRGRSESVRDTRVDGALITYLPGSALVLLALAVLHAGWSRPEWTSTGSLAGETAFRLLALGQGLLVVLMALVARSLYRRAPEPRTTLYGLGGPSVAMLACALGGVMTGGVAQRVADWLDGPGTPGMGRGSVIEGPPVLLSWQASVIPVLLLLLLVPVVFLVVRTARRARRMGPDIEAEYAPNRLTPAAPGASPASAPRPPSPTRPLDRRRGLRRDPAPRHGGRRGLLDQRSGARPRDGRGRGARRIARRGRPVDRLLADRIRLRTVRRGRPPRLPGRLRPPHHRHPLGRGHLLAARRPPLRAPCYAERAVPDLASRMSAWTATTRGRLIISGHSQGSVLAAAAVWQLPDAARRRVGLLTYGSPVERLYGRWFPSYFGAVPLLGLHRSVHCWRNLYRATDPIGGPVRLRVGPDAGVDRGPLKDPQAYGRTTALPLPEPILGHSDYQADPVFAKERAALLEELGPRLPRQGEGGETLQKGQKSSGRSSG